MADSPIIVTNLTAQGGAQQIALDFAVQDLEILPYLRRRAIEVFAATSNNRALAEKVGETETLQFLHSGLGVSETRYYWARVRDGSGNHGDFYPASSGAGIAASTTATALGPDSVGPDELQNNAVRRQHILAGSVTADRLAVLSLSAISADMGTLNSGTVNSGTMRTSASGQRAELNGSANRLIVYNAAGQVIGSLGKGQAGETVLYVNNPSLAAAAYLSNTSTGGAVVCQGYVNVAAAWSGAPALTARGSSGSGSNHGIRGSANGGGSGLLGVSAGGGGFGLYAESGGVGPFTGQHDGLIAFDDAAEPGDIVIDTGRILARASLDDALGVNARSNVQGDTRVYGVISKRLAFDAKCLLAGLAAGSFVHRFAAERFDRLVVNSLGEGQINVCGRGGDIAAGDLIWSSGLPGKGEKQADDVMRSMTVAKAREAATFGHPDQVKRIACTYHCG